MSRDARGMRKLAGRCASGSLTAPLGVGAAPDLALAPPSASPALPLATLVPWSKTFMSSWGELWYHTSMGATHPCLVQARHVPSLMVAIPLQVVGGTPPSASMAFARRRLTLLLAPSRARSSHKMRALAKPNQERNALNHETR
jgi:hypothetical protein